MNLVVQFSMSCAFRCIALRLAAYLLYHFVVRLSRGFSNFFQVFFALSAFADLAVPLSCSSDSIPHSSSLVNPFLQVFSGFFDFSCRWGGKGKLRWALVVCFAFFHKEYHIVCVDFIGSSRGRLERDRGFRSPIPLQHLS